MQRTMAIDDIDDAIDERLPLEVAKLAEGQIAAKMIVAVRVTSRTMQRTFARDLDRQRGLIPSKDSTPSREDPVHPATIAAEVWYP